MMEIVDKIIIPQGTYSGYIWESDKKQPRVLDKETLSETLKYSASSNPFVVEGQLYDEGNGISYSIKYIDGMFYYMEYKNPDKDDNCEEKCFLASFDKAPGRLRFRQYWGETEENGLYGMKTLCPKEFMFVGFERKENKK